MLNSTAHVAAATFHGESPSAPAFAASAVRATAAKRIDSERLLGGGRELVIEHAGQEYRLRLTRNDKLILTK